MKKILFLTFLFFAAHQKVFSCSCDLLYLDDAFRNSISVASGKVRAIHPYQPDSNFYRIEFEVFEEFKGSNLEEFFIFDPNSPCGVNFDIGDELLVYLAVTEFEIPVLHYCSRFFNLKEISQNSPEIEILRTLKQLDFSDISSFEVKIPYTEEILDRDFFSNLSSLIVNPSTPEYGIYEINYHHLFDRSEGKIVKSLGKNIDNKIIKMIEASSWELFDYYEDKQPSPVRFFIVLYRRFNQDLKKFEIYRYRYFWESTFSLHNSLTDNHLDYESIRSL